MEFADERGDVAGAAPADLARLDSLLRRQGAEKEGMWDDLILSDGPMEDPRQLRSELDTLARRASQVPSKARLHARLLQARLMDKAATGYADRCNRLVEKLNAASREDDAGRHLSAADRFGEVARGAALLRESLAADSALLATDGGMARFSDLRARSEELGILAERNRATALHNHAAVRTIELAGLISRRLVPRKRAEAAIDSLLAIPELETDLRRQIRALREGLPGLR
jgi:hypothetical protein